VKRWADDGHTIVLIGHAGHEEVVGTMGEAPDSIVLVESAEAVASLELPAGASVAYIAFTAPCRVVA